jgi:endonuclease YncB( thermonuclease family)
MIAPLRLPLVFLLLALPAGPAAGEGLPEGLLVEAHGTVVEVIDGDTVVLDDRSEVRLVGTQAPKLPLGRPGFPTWPLAAEAKAALEDLVLGREVGLAYGGARSDRYGRRLAHLMTDAGVWVQGAMLAAGMARVYSFPDNRTGVAEMLGLELRARRAGRGIWALPWYGVRSADALGEDIDTFQLVEGRVADAADVRGRIFLNFGPDRLVDFTVTIAPADRAAFEEARLDPLALEGERVRVRGWLYERDGPAIEATHPEQIEVLAGE